ncbi:MAG TPA: PAS domain-containing sensor histidine kinase [Gemmatimonadales bacterium]|nr:PAS domain-containing sensor histidine kinase [Gemmatimonadales bacterium]
MRRKRASGKRRTPTPGVLARLHEAEATLEAIRTGTVDAVVVSGPGGEKTRAFEGATHPYHVLLNAMNDGAALLTEDGTVLFGNRRLAEIAHAPLERLRGSRFPEFVAPAERPNLEAFVRQGQPRGREFTITGADGSVTPVWIALSLVPLDGGNGHTVRMAIITDLTDRKRAESTRLGLLKRLLSAEDQERRRIARELHDETGQSLTTLLVGLRAIGDKTRLAEVRSMAQRLREVASHTVDDVGRLARGLHPAVLDDKGLVAAMRRHASDFAKAFGVVVDLRVQARVARRLSPLVQSTAYRILQEALTNVARHARAHRVGVVLTHKDAMLELVIHDDGVGFDPAAALNEASGLGLHGMQERVALLGGSVQIASRAGHGTTILARIPTGRISSRGAD